MTLRDLPSVHELAASLPTLLPGVGEAIPQPLLVMAARVALNEARERLRAGRPLTASPEDAAVSSLQSLLKAEALRWIFILLIA